MGRTKALALYLALFRYVPLGIILFSALLWRFAGDKVAVTACALLFAADAALLITLAVRSGRGKR